MVPLGTGVVGHEGRIMLMKNHGKLVICGLLAVLVVAAVCVTIILVTENEKTVAIGGGDSNVDTPGIGQGYFDARVLEKYDDHIIVECTEGYQEGVSTGDRLSVSLNTISDEPVPTVQAGNRVRVLYIGELSRDDDGVIAPQDTISLFLIDEDGDTVS